LKVALYLECQEFRCIPIAKAVAEQIMITF
jgi:hypothetical protein